MSNPLHAAIVAADALISRMEEIVADQLTKQGDLDEAAAFYRIVEILETAAEITAEITAVRLALGEDPARFGEPTSVAAG